MREGLVRQNPARVVSTPRLPKRLPRVIGTCDEMSALLDRLAQGPRSQPTRACGRHQLKRARNAEQERLLLKRDRAILELLYASGLRVSELAGLDVDSIDRENRMLRVLGKGRKERVIPFGSKAAEESSGSYWPSCAAKSWRSRKVKPAYRKAVFVNYRGGRLTVAIGAHARGEILAAREHRLEPASPLPAARLCDAPAGRRGGPARDSGITWATSRHFRRRSRVYPSDDRAVDGGLRQSTPTRLGPRRRPRLAGTGILPRGNFPTRPD